MHNYVESNGIFHSLWIGQKLRGSIESFRILNNFTMRIILISDSASVHFSHQARTDIVNHIFALRENHSPGVCQFCPRATTSYISPSLRQTTDGIISSSEWVDDKRANGTTQTTTMENLKNFIGNVMVAGGSNASANRSNGNPIATVADKSQQNSNSGALNYAWKTPLRNRTESECSNASVSSTTSSIDTPSHFGRPVTQKDKDSYFWVM